MLARLLSQFKGGQPMTLSPDGRTVATVTFGRQTTLWNVANPRHPVKIATLPATDGNTLWGQTFSPDGRILATGYYDGIALWDVTSPARARLLRSLNATLTSPAQAAVGSGGETALGLQAIAFSPDRSILASVTWTPGSRCPDEGRQCGAATRLTIEGRHSTGTAQQDDLRGPVSASNPAPGRPDSAGPGSPGQPSAL